MTAVGVSLGTATAVASIRGLLSLPGRALMGPAVQRLGVPRAVGLVYVLMIFGTAPLAGDGSIALLVAFVVVSGLVFGTIAPLHGLYAADVYGERRIGTMMGVQSLVGTVISAFGPTALGATVDITGEYRVAILLACALFGSAFVLLVTRPRDNATAAA